MTIGLSAIVNKSTETQSHELSTEFAAFVKMARDVYVEDASGTVVDNSPASILYLAKGILSVGQRSESLTAETYFLTTADFVDGAGVAYPAGVSVAVHGTSQNKKYKVLPSDFHMEKESAITAIQRDNSTIYSLSGGRFSFSAGDTALDADVVRASVEVMQDNTFTLSAYLNSGTLGSTTFPSGTVVLTGESQSTAADGAKLTLHIKEARFYFTQNLTEWERRSVAWDLFQYGQEVLEKVSQPSYSFTVDSADFLVMDEFEAFKSALSMGKRVYLKLDDGWVLTPLLLGFSHTFDEKSGLPLEFSNKFTSSNENDRLVDLLEQSVSMGKKLDLSREVYSAFVDSHANTAIHDFMNGALDVAKNSILSTTGQAIFWDENGLRLCKWNSDRTGYEPEQIWMKDNLIVFTEDAWLHAKMAIGHIHDNELGDLWGVIADSIVGKLLAGENLIIMGTDATGKKTLFRVDGSGMYAYNSRFWMESINGGAFAVDPSFGLGLGQGNPFVVADDGTIVPKCIDPQTGELKLDKDGFPVGMNFWAGLDGQVYVRGHLVMESGEAHGDFYADNFYFNDGDSVRTLISKTAKGNTVDFSDLDYIDLGGIVLDGKTGNINFTGAGSITWGNNAPVKYQFAQAQTGPWHDTMETNNKYRRDSLDGGTTWGTAYQFRGTDGANGSDANVPSYIQSTYIDATKVESFYIKGNKIEAVCPAGSEGDSEIGFILTGRFEAQDLRYLRICSYTDIAPYVSFSSPNGCFASWDFGRTVFRGSLDFSLADTYGLHVTLA